MKPEVTNPLYRILINSKNEVSPYTDSSLAQEVINTLNEQAKKVDCGFSIGLVNIAASYYQAWSMAIHSKSAEEMEKNKDLIIESLVTDYKKRLKEDVQEMLEHHNFSDNKEWNSDISPDLLTKKLYVPIPDCLRLIYKDINLHKPKQAFFNTEHLSPFFSDMDKDWQLIICDYNRRTRLRGFHGYGQAESTDIAIVQASNTINDSLDNLSLPTKKLLTFAFSKNGQALSLDDKGHVYLYVELSDYEYEVGSPEEYGPRTHYLIARNIEQIISTGNSYAYDLMNFYSPSKVNKDLLGPFKLENHNNFAGNESLAKFVKKDQLVWGDSEVVDCADDYESVIERFFISLSCESLKMSNFQVMSSDNERYLIKLDINNCPFTLELEITSDYINPEIAKQFNRINLTFNGPEKQFYPVYAPTWGQEIGVVYINQTQYNLLKKEQLLLTC